jgi:TIR domain
MPRTRRTYAEIFIAKLEELSNGGQKLVGNGNLREALGWPDDRYDRIHGQLKEEGAIIVGRGQGGSVGLGEVAGGGNALKVFIAYSHIDKDLKSRLLGHLKPLERQGLISTWHDQEIRPGDEWDEEIADELDDADIILLLISVDFINSEYCADVELDRALELHANGDARVIPVILRSCLWNKMPFAKLQALPNDGHAINTWRDQDEAFVSVAESIRQIAEDMLSST